MLRPGLKALNPAACALCRELEAIEAEAEAKKREERRRQERKNRDAFTALLRRHAAEGKLTAHMRFKVRQVPARRATEDP